MIVGLTNENSKAKILIIEDDPEERKSLLNFLGNDNEIEICRLLGSGFDIISIIKFHKPDVVLADFLASDVDGTNVLDKINSSFTDNDKPRVIVMSSLENMNVLEKSFSYGIDYYIRKPIIFSLLKDVILSVCHGRKSTVSDAVKIIKIKNFVRSVGVPLNVLGYTYIVEALNYMLSSDKTIFLSEVYRHICKYNETSTECVEVAIRNTIKKAVKTGNEKFKEIFGACGENLSNSLFLTTLKEVFFITNASEKL